MDDIDNIYIFLHIFEVFMKMRPAHHHNPHCILYPYDCCCYIWRMYIPKSTKHFVTFCVYQGNSNSSSRYVNKWERKLFPVTGFVLVYLMSHNRSETDECVIQYLLPYRCNSRLICQKQIQHQVNHISSNNIGFIEMQNNITSKNALKRCNYL